jgi:hypothetical protein
MYHQRLIIAALTAEILNRNALCPFTRLDINNHPVYQRLTSKKPLPCSSTAKPSLKVSSHFSTSAFLKFPENQ